MSEDRCTWRRRARLPAALLAVMLLITFGAGTVSALTWQIETVHSDGTVSGYYHGYSSLVLDNAGNPRISFFDDRNDREYINDLVYAWRDTAGWHIETVDSAGYVGTFNSLALNSAGNPGIAYSDDTNGHLKYAWHDTSGWHTETADSEVVIQGGATGTYPSLALDGSGNPRISYHEGMSGSSGHYGILKYAWRNDAGWHTERVGSENFVGLDTSLALDSAGNPRISYYDENNENLMYAWRDASGWHTETVDPEGNAGRYTSLVLDGAGSPRISYKGDSKLKYAWRDGAGWHIETVDSGSSSYTSLALDSAGNPRISYTVLSDLKYAWHDDGGWHTAKVGSERTGYDGTSLALDGTGNPRISYFATNSNLMFASGTSLLPMPGGTGAPTDTDGDGKYEDVNGNGRKDFADVTLYFNQMSWIAANEPTALFDCNGNGRIDFADVVWLFNNL